MSFWRVIAIWLAAQPFLALAWWAWRERQDKARRREVEIRLAEAARMQTMFAQPPVGPTGDALRASHLRQMLDKTWVRA